MVPAATIGTSRRGLLALGLGAGAAALLRREAGAQEATAAPLVVYAVRHAEKGGEGRDPELSLAGKARATELARVLGDVPLDGVYSTSTIRTRATAGPIAKAKALEVQEYRPGEELIERLQAGEARTVLVVGHSNTTPDLLRGLGASCAIKLLDGYDDLFLVVGIPAGATLLQRLRYGAVSKDPGH